ncbi:MAG: hypothetical protein KDN19_18080, partial [Verrucomicrobiae bacterium]|nr:hypothetical protein [Verrucomicrobiae bacterium]
MRDTFRFLVLAALVFLGFVVDLPAQEVGGGGVDLEFTHSISGLGTKETASREIGGVAVTFPVDESDTVEALRPFLEMWLEKRGEAAAMEAKELTQALRDPELLELVRKNVQGLLGGGGLSDGAGEVLRVG